MSTTQPSLIPKVVVVPKRRKVLLKDADKLIRHIVDTILLDGDRRCLVYSLMQHGALGEARNSVLLCSDMSFCADDRLACLDQSPPLSAARRVRIAADIVFGLVRIYC